MHFHCCTSIVFPASLDKVSQWCVHIVHSLLQNSATHGDLGIFVKSMVEAGVAYQVNTGLIPILQEGLGMGRADVKICGEDYRLLASFRRPHPAFLCTASYLGY